MQKSKVNIQKVSINTKPFPIAWKQAVFSLSQKSMLRVIYEIFILLLLLLAAISIFLAHMLILALRFAKAYLTTKIHSLTLKKMGFYAKVGIVIFVGCLLFKNQIGLSFSNNGISFSTKQEGPIFSGFNPMAPADLDQLHHADNLAYIKKYSTIAKAEMRKHNIPASISLAQAIIESRAGKSRLATQNNNHFGIKCFKKRCKKGHCSNYSDDHHKDFFRIYDSPEQSWKDHSSFLLKSRYSELFTYGNNYKKWAHGLHSNGYATDKNYAKKLIRTVERYKLHKLDR